MSGVHNVPTIPISVLCVSEYIFNKSDTFKGVIFNEGDIYISDFINVREHGLYAVFFTHNNSVGMNSETFNNHFKCA